MAKEKAESKAQKLLQEYRPIAWRKSALEAVPGMSQDVLQACVTQMKLTQALVDILRKSIPMGEKLYWITYITYMTEQQPGGVYEILDLIAKNHEPIPRRTYFRLKNRAISILDSSLVEMAKESAPPGI